MSQTPKNVFVLIMTMTSNLNTKNLKITLKPTVIKREREAIVLIRCLLVGVIFFLSPNTWFMIYLLVWFTSFSKNSDTVTAALQKQSKLFLPFDCGRNRGTFAFFILNWKFLEGRQTIKKLEFWCKYMPLVVRVFISLSLFTCPVTHNTPANALQIHV